MPVLKEPQSGAETRQAESPRRALSLSVLIPAYNERETIRQTLQRVRALGADIEIVVVDDASTDGTREILEQETGIVLVKHERNGGKGRAIRTGLDRVTGDVVAIQDADLEYDPQDLLRLMEPIAEGRARVVYGSRFLRGRPRMRWPNYICNRMLAWAANLLFNARLSDEATCYKVFDRKLILSLSLRCERFEFCPEVTAKVRKRGEKIVELPISYDPRSYDSGKKIRPWDGVVALWTLIKYRFTD